MFSQGILLALVSGIIVGVSVFLQKLGVDESNDLFSQIKSFKWLLGAVLAGCSFIIYLWAVSLDRISLIQPIMNISLIVILFLEYAIMKIEFHKYSIIAIILFFIGIILQVGLI
jgi:uncharacterized membrane protein